MTAAQWLEVERRHVVGGEAVNKLAKEYGVDESSMRRKIKPTLKERASGVTTLRSLAARKVNAMARAADVDAEIQTLPVTKQIIVGDLIQQMQTISGHLATAAEYGADTARRLACIANGMVIDMDPRKPLDVPKLTQVAALTKLYTESGAMGLALVAGNRSAPPGPPPDTLSDLSDEELAAELARHGIEPPAA